MQLLSGLVMYPTGMAFLVMTMILIRLIVSTRKSHKWTKGIATYKSIYPMGHVYHLLTNSTLRRQNSGGVALVLLLIGFEYSLKPVNFFLFKLGFTNVVVLSSPEAAQVLLKNKDEISKSTFYQPLKSGLGEGLITSRGDEVWKLHRKTMNPMFHTKMLERFQTVMSKHSITMVNLLEKCDGHTIVAQELFGPCTFDVVVEASTGKDSSLQNSEDKQILKSIERFMEIAAQRGFYPWLSPNFIFRLTTLGKESKSHSEYAVNYFRHLLKERRECFLKSKVSLDFDDERPCLLDAMLEQQFQGKEHFSDEEIVHELQNIAIPGFETSTAALSFTIFAIGHHPDVQRKLHDELDDIFGSNTEREITSLDCLKMKYLDCVIKESLRYFPPVPIIVRTLKNDLQIDKKTIPSGTDVCVFSPTVHRSEKHFQNPNKFDPDRFMVDDPNQHETAFIPFSFGSRSCIGGSFALRTMRTILAAILRRFEVKSVDPFDSLFINFATIGKPHKPVLIKLKKRQF